MSNTKVEKMRLQVEREKAWLNVLEHGSEQISRVLTENPLLTGLIALTANWGLYKMGFWDARPSVDASTVVHHEEVGHWQFVEDGKPSLALPSPAASETIGGEPPAQPIEVSGRTEYIVPVETEEGTKGLVVPAPGGIESELGTLESGGYGTGGYASSEAITSLVSPTLMGIEAAAPQPSVLQRIVNWFKGLFGR